MPNTLAHLGAQALLSRAALRGADVKWIWAGAVLPDLPWVAQRVLARLLPETLLLDLRLYATAQASLALCLLLAGAMACCARARGRVFAILALGAALHLLLDAAQTKWANGVHLLAPFDWEMLNFGVFWPEDWPTWALIALGAAAVALALRYAPPHGRDLIRPRGRAALLAAGLLGLYLAAPFALLGAIEAADAHFVGTLRAKENRPGRPIEFDRARFVADPAGGGAIVIWSRERIEAVGATPAADGKISAKGRFLTPGRVELSAHRLHPPGLRDGASLLGLAIVAAWWLAALVNATRLAARE